jgi:hypothetical protein
MMCSDLVVFFIYLTNNWTTYDDVFILIIVVICCHLGLSQIFLLLKRVASWVVTTPTSAVVTTSPYSAANQTNISCIKISPEPTSIQKLQPISHTYVDSYMAGCSLAHPSIQAQLAQVNQSHPICMSWSAA